MKDTLTALHHLKERCEKSYEELEHMLMDDETVKYSFSRISQEMAVLRLAIRIIEKDIEKGN